MRIECIGGSVLRAYTYLSPTFLPNTVNGEEENIKNKNLLAHGVCAIISHRTSCTYVAVVRGQAWNQSDQVLFCVALERMWDFSAGKRVADARMPNTGIINDWHMAVAKIVSAREWMDELLCGAMRRGVWGCGPEQICGEKAFKEIFIIFMCWIFTRISVCSISLR